MYAKYSNADNWMCEEIGTFGVLKYSSISDIYMEVPKLPKWFREIMYDQEPFIFGRFFSTFV